MFPIKTQLAHHMDHVARTQKPEPHGHHQPIQRQVISSIKTTANYLPAVFFSMISWSSGASADAFELSVLCFQIWPCLMFWMFALMQEYKRTGDSRFLFCLPPGFKVQGALYFWSYVYYLSKFYELLDTAILVLRGKVFREPRTCV